MTDRRTFFLYQSAPISFKSVVFFFQGMQEVEVQISTRLQNFLHVFIFFNVVFKMVAKIVEFYTYMLSNTAVFHIEISSVD